MATSSSDARVFAGVDAVTVPDGTALGQHFTAHVWAMQRGARVPRLRHFWRASGNAPVIATATVAVAQGPRHAQRPSAVARRVSGTAGAQAIDHQRTEQCSITEWQTSVELPIELHEHDVGWLPGPVGGRNGRPFPTFTGESSGPRDRELTSRSTARRIMRSVQLSRSFKDTVVTLTRQHAQQWSAEHDRCDGTERCFSAADLEPVHVELWAALAVRVAKLNPSIPADRLWDATHHCYDAAVDAACTHTQWQWLNRHLSFGAMRVVGANGVAASYGRPKYQNRKMHLYLNPGMGIEANMATRARIRRASTPFRPPRLTLSGARMVSHTGRSNVRRGARATREIDEIRCPIRGLRPIDIAF